MAILRRTLKWTAIVSVALVAGFLLSAWIGSAIPRNSGWTEPDEGVTLFIGSNGIHTEIAMPIESDAIDWREHFPLSDLKASDRNYTHVAVSWGEKSFFLETPSWSEFDLMTGLGALTGGDALLHAVFYEDPAPRDDFREIRVRTEEYAALVKQILADLPPPEVRKTYSGYGTRDVFYDALGDYHIANTCNQWTSDRLARAGVKVGWWTPLPGGVMRWIDAPE